MRVGILGGGRAAWTFASLFKRLEWEITGVVSRTARTEFEQAGIEHRDLGAIVEQSDLLLIAVPDQSVCDVAAAARSHGDPVAFHVSGSIESSKLPFTRRFSLHPLRALAPVGDAVDLRGTLFVFEGQREHRHVAEALVAAAAGRLADIDTSQKALYHSAAVFASNYVAAILGVAEKQMENAGIGSDARAALAELARSAVGNWERQTGEARITGPIARGDVDCIEAHLAALGTGEVARLYRTLGLTLTRQLSKTEERRRIADLLAAD